MNAPVTIFTTCKPFQGIFDAIQRNALSSWTRIEPACQVIVFGDEPGVAECCRDLGLLHVPEIARSEHGAPLMDEMFRRAEQIGSGEVLACVNADIMLTSNLLAAVERVREHFGRFLMISRRWNLDVEGDWSFDDPHWEEQLLATAQQQGTREAGWGGIDLFAFPRGQWENLPAFAMGRPRFDSALIYLALRAGSPVVDATDCVVPVHQNHDYSHHPDRARGVFAGPDARRNEHLLGGEEFIFTALSATHVLGRDGLRRYYPKNPIHALRRAANLAAFDGPLRPLAPLVRALAPAWRSLRDWPDRLRQRMGRARRVRSERVGHG